MNSLLLVGDLTDDNRMVAARVRLQQGRRCLTMPRLGGLVEDLLRRTTGPALMVVDVDTIPETPAQARELLRAADPARVTCMLVGARAADIAADVPAARAVDRRDLPGALARIFSAYDLASPLSVWPATRARIRAGLRRLHTGRGRSDTGPIGSDKPNGRQR